MNNVIKDKNLNISNKEIVYEKKIEDNKGIYYYPLKRNFASIEEEKNYIHYYGEDNIDRVSRINDSLSKKENFIQDDVITNFIFIYLMSYIQDYSELMKVMKVTLKLKNILIVVKDIERSRQFYHDIFGLELILDNDGNMILSEGLVLQDEKIWKNFLGKSNCIRHGV